MDAQDQINQNNLLLIVDDNAPTRRLLRGVLGKQGFSCLEAADGVDGVALFEQQHPTLVLLDVIMPRMDGFTACVQMRALDQDEGTPIIILTGAEDFTAIEKAFDAGATDFITKPISWTLLIQRIRYALRAGRLNRQVRQNQLKEASARRIAKLVFWEWHLNNDTLHWSDDLKDLIGITKEELSCSEDLLSVVHPKDRKRARRLFQLTRTSLEPLEIELRLLTDTSINGVPERVVRMVGERGSKGRDHNLIFGALQDVTSLRQTEALVDYLAFHDELTELGNRRLFLRQVNKMLKGRIAKKDGVLLIGWIDIAGFHRHNESLGEANGDLLLREIARRLRRLVNTGETVARIGGDEFAVLLHTPCIATARARFEAMLFALRHPFQISSQETILTFYAGIAYYPDHGTDANQLLILAQDAQRLARTQGRPLLFATLNENSQSRFTEDLAVEGALHKALEQNEFFLVYQPQMDLRSGQIVGVESLLRWRHPTWGLVSPSRFVSLLENLGLIIAVGHWVLEEGCRQAVRWAEAGLALRVSINLSPRQFLEPNLFDQILKILNQTNVQSGMIKLEITESLAMQDPGGTIALLQRLRKIGLKIAIDDFGIGHSSLEYLLRFPIDTIKIDQIFVRNITRIQTDRAIVRAVTAIGQTLGLDIVAEGVETVRQCDFLEALGVTEIQGYLIGKPMEPADIEALMQGFTRPGLDQT